VLEVDLVSGAVLGVAIYVFNRSIGRVERHFAEMSATLVEMRVALEEMQNQLRTIDGGVADIHNDGRAFARALSQEKRWALHQKSLTQNP
jgi:hypothetical protein